jgi:hypothetical protein
MTNLDPDTSTQKPHDGLLSAESDKPVGGVFCWTCGVVHMLGETCPRTRNDQPGARSVPTSTD